MDASLALIGVLIFAILGCLLGLGAGLVPGLHANNIALTVFVLAPAIVPPLVPSVGADGATVLVAALLAAAAIAHGFAALLPTVFLGAPDPETALSMLPAHRLLAAGRGMDAVLLAARGGLIAVFLALSFLLPFRLLLGDPVDAYGKLRPFIVPCLFLLIALLLATEGRGHRARQRRAWSLVYLLLSGGIGWVVLEPGFLESAWRPLPVHSESLILFPLFTGLFGMPALLLSWNYRRRLPPQLLGPADPSPSWRLTRGALAGAVAGATVSWFPGLGGASATIVAQLLGGGEPREGDPKSDREFVLAAGAANAATILFTIGTLFTVLRARSGVAAVIDTLAGSVPPWEPVTSVPPMLTAILLATAVSAVLAHRATRFLARPFAKFATRVPYGDLVRWVSMALAAAVFALTGPIGALVLLGATAIGMGPPLLGIRRVHLMGCLLLPLLAASS